MLNSIVSRVEIVPRAFTDHEVIAELKRTLTDRMEEAANVLKVREMVESLERVAGADPVKLIDWQPDPFIVKIVGSYTNIVGLPLYETTNLLAGEGFPVRFGWLNAV